MTKALLYKGDNLNRANMVWNIAGSFVYAFASMVLSFLVIRLAGEEQEESFPSAFPLWGSSCFWWPTLAFAPTRSRMETGNIPSGTTAGTGM